MSRSFKKHCGSTICSAIDKPWIKQRHSAMRAKERDLLRLQIIYPKNDYCYPIPREGYDWEIKLSTLLREIIFLMIGSKWLGFAGCRHQKLKQESINVFILYLGQFVFLFVFCNKDLQRNRKSNLKA